MQIQQKYQMQKYQPQLALQIPDFRQALEYYVRRLRWHGWISAYYDTREKFNGELAIEASRYCYEMGITYRLDDGRMMLSEGYVRMLP